MGRRRRSRVRPYDPAVRRGEALAVRTLGRDGEELAYSDPRVPDAERAAAGLVTVAGRQRELDEGNRSRAAKRWGRGLAALPADANLVRVWAPRPLTELRRRLRGRRLAMWRDGAVLHVIWRGQALAAHLVGGIQLPLWLIDGSDLWELSVVVRGLDQAVVEIRVLPLQDDSWAWLGVALVVLVVTGVVHGLWFAPTASMEPSSAAGRSPSTVRREGTASPSRSST